MTTRRKQSALSAAVVRTIMIPGTYSDGNGLTLRVEPGGTKHWVQRVTVGGRRRNIGLGSFPAVSLADARELAAANQRSIRQGRDPFEEKRRAAEELRRPAVPTFAAAAERVIDMRRPTWSNAKHASQWTNTLAAYAHPVIGRKPVDEITTADVLAVLTPIWTAKTETATRVLQRMETVFDWVVAQGWRPDNPAGRAVTRALPRMQRTKKNHTALPYAEVPGALKQVRESGAGSITTLSFEFLVLTAARSGEVRQATWEEIDLKTSVWTVPTERMKARKEHKVPLCGRAVEILWEVRNLVGQDSRLVFPTGRHGKPLSDMAYTALLRRLEIPAVAHGFRSSFKDWCSEMYDGDDRWLLSEKALAHNLGNAATTAYARSDLLDLRRPLMEAWAKFLEPGLAAARALDSRSNPVDVDRGGKLLPHDG